MISLVTTEERPNHRRRMLAILPLALFGAGWWSRTIAFRQNSDVVALANRVVRLLGLDAHLFRDAIAEVAHDVHINELTEAILGAQLTTVAALSDQELRRRVKRNIVADYETGRIRHVRGWILSKTENNALTLAAYLRHAKLNR